jgi:hypothetical protein
MTLTPEEFTELRAMAEAAAHDGDRPLPIPGSTVLALLDMIGVPETDPAGAWPDELTAMGFAPDS